MTARDLRASAGNVDANGDIVDALDDRLRHAIGPHRARDVDQEDQLQLVHALLAFAAAAKAEPEQTAAAARAAAA